MKQFTWSEMGKQTTQAEEVYCPSETLSLYYQSNNSEVSE